MTEQRVIKFRAWDVVSQQMREVEEITFNKDGTLDGCLYEKAGDDYGRVYFNQDCLVDGKFHEHIILLQFIGPHDKNGKEIYEGDIIDFNGHPTAIRWSTIQACYIFDNNIPGQAGQEYLDAFIAENYEVIGNIYENPELLKIEEI